MSTGNKQCILNCIFSEIPRAFFVCFPSEYRGRFKNAILGAGGMAQ